MAAFGNGCDLQDLLSRRRGARFDVALAQLLRAYDSDLESLRLRLPAELAAAAREPGGVGAVRHCVQGGPSEGDRPATCKSADMPVDGELALGSRQGEEEEEELARDARGSAPSEAGNSQALDAVALFSEGTRLSEASAQSRRMFASKGQMPTFLQEREKDMANISKSSQFEAASSAILLVFCVLTALEMQRDGLYLGFELGWPGYRDPRATVWAQAGDTFSALMVACSALFAAEVIFRMLALRRQFFTDAWNCLDAAILLSLAVDAVGAQLSMDTGATRVLRLMRILRFVRLLRFARRFQELYFLGQALSNCRKVLMWCCLILIAIQMLTAFVINQSLFVFYFPGLGRPLEERQEVFKYFGSFARALVTTFEMAMGNWPVPARVLFEYVSEWSLIFCLFHKMTIGLSIIAIINAVFMQETMMLAMSDDAAMYMKKSRQSGIIQAKLSKFFRAADTTGDGRIDLDEFKNILDKEAVRIWLSSFEFECKDPDGIFQLLDEDGRGDLSADEFFRGMKSLGGNAKAVDMVRLLDEVRALRATLCTQLP